MAKTALARAKYAREGLAHRQVDRTTRAMLLRQLYLAHMEGQRFEQALKVAQEMTKLAVLEDVARQDVARAHLGLRDIPSVILELRVAGRVSPPSRRAFHLWTLGSVLYLNGRPKEAAGAFLRATRWGTHDKPLYQAQRALALLDCGEEAGDLELLREKLSSVPCGRGYGEFVIGELSFRLGDRDAAREALESFVERITGGRIALAVSLEGELRRAREVLGLLASGTGWQVGDG